MQLLLVGTCIWLKSLKTNLARKLKSEKAFILYGTHYSQVFVQRMLKLSGLLNLLWKH